MCSSEVPGFVAEDAAFLAVLKLVDRGRLGRADHPAQAHPRGLMRARVLERMKLAVEIENADLAPLDADDLATAGWNFVNARHDVLAHLEAPTTERFGASRRWP